MTVPTDIKEDEMKAVEELRKRMISDMEPEMCDDTYLLYRFLKARELNVDSAEDMLRKHLDWYEENEMKDILRFKMPEVIEKYITYNFVGFDKEGCVVRYVPIGKMDIVGIINSAKQEDLERSMIYVNECDGIKLRMQSKELMRNVDKCIYIFNMEHITFTTVSDKRVIFYLMTLLNMYQNNYPERIKAAYIINSSIYFSMLYSILKRCLEASILSKLHIYSDDSWKEELQKEIDAEVLPAFLGGSRKDPDGNPLCLTLLNHGEPVPEKYFIHKSKRSLANMEGVKKITLSRAAFHEEVMEVKEPGSCFEWEFETKSRDIGFGVFYEETVDGEQKMIELIPHQRIDTEEYSETGTYMCERAGKYVFLFDNTYSWIRSKEIYYRIKVVTPEEQEAELQ